MAIILNNINGLADSKWSGIKGSVASCVGLDIHSTPGLTQVQQKLTKESGSTVTELCKWAVNCSNGYSFWFSADSGKIWARSSAGTWSLALTTTAAAGEVKCLGAMEFNGYIYWATQSRLHRIAIANADDSWAGHTLNWATFGVTNINYHPMAIQDLSLFIGDGYQVASVDDAGTFNANALDINSPYVIKSMTDFEIDILIGTEIASTVNEARLFRWDCVSPSWNSSDDVGENGINAFIKDDNYTYISAGRVGNIYFYNGEKLEAYIRIPGTYTTASATGVQIFAGSTATFRGVPVFGLSNYSGNPALQGVYSFGAYSKNYSKVLDLTFPISEDELTGKQLGAIIVSGTDLFVAWSGNGSGVDKIDYTAKYASAYFETTMLFQGDRDKLKVLKEISLFYNSLPASTGVTFSYSINGASYVAMTSVVDSVLARVKASLTVTKVGSIQVKVAFTVSANTAPTMEALGCEIT